MTILSGRSSDSVLGKRKDTEPCRSQFAEQEQEQEAEQEQEQADAASEIKDAATENKDAAAKYEDDDDDDDDDVSKNECPVCLQLGHWPFLCPYKRRVPEGTEVVGPGYMLVCYHCGDYEFDKLKCCVLCGDSRKRLCSIVCSICAAKDHLFEVCPYKGMVDFDFYVPPPAGAQGVCAGE